MQSLWPAVSTRPASTSTGQGLAAGVCSRPIGSERGSKFSRKARSLAALAVLVPFRPRRRQRGRMAMIPRFAVAQDSGVLLIEHLNLNVSNGQVALDFYEALGCCRDARRPLTKTLHSNCGTLTQFHTPSPDNEAYIADAGPQQWRGQISLAYPTAAQLKEAAERLRHLQSKEHFRETKLDVGDWQEKSQDLKVLGPYGNRFHLHVASDDLRHALGTAGRPGSEKSTCVGMDALTLEVPVGTAEKAAQFYKEVLCCELTEGPRPGVLAGPGLKQELCFQEVEGCTGAELGEHMAIYVADFEGCFQRLLDRGLVWVNPRFVHLDKSTNLEEALHYSCFRFKDVVDVSSGQKLFELEHEVRNTGHKSWPLAR